MTEKSAPAALNRYIYYPDHLVRMPSPNPNLSVAQNVTSILSTILREPVFESFISGVLLDPVRPPSPPYVLDESVAEFVSRRFSPRVAENLVSALYHGIYAGDINQLSAQALLGRFRNLEFSGRGVIGGMIDQTTSGIKSMFTDDLLALEAIGSDRFVSIDSSGSYLKSLSSLVKKASVITFKEGMSELPNALNKALCSSDNVQVLNNTNIKAITRDTDTSDITVRLQHHLHLTRSNQFLDPCDNGRGRDRLSNTQSRDFYNRTPRAGTSPQYTRQFEPNAAGGFHPTSSPRP